MPFLAPWSAGRGVFWGKERGPLLVLHFLITQGVLRWGWEGGGEMALRREGELGLRDSSYYLGGRPSSYRGGGTLSQQRRRFILGKEVDFESASPATYLRTINRREGVAFIRSIQRGHPPIPFVGFPLR